MSGHERRTVLVLALTLAAIAVGVVGTSRFVLRPYSVAGTSMEPTLVTGDRVLVRLRGPLARAVGPGDVVLLRAPDGTEMLKRVTARRRSSPGAGDAVWVLGDNPSASLDSRVFGAIAIDAVVGRVVFRYAPLSRIGTIEASDRRAAPPDDSAAPPGR